MTIVAQPINPAVMNVIKTQAALDSFCEAAKTSPFLCVDTEFMRETTYYSILCLIQAATDKDEVIIDPVADDIDLEPFMDLLANSKIMKVMHAARQDLEIFHNISGRVPAPLFDSQIAAMALGYGDSIGYMALVKGRLNINLDKGARFTDWSRRPLSEKQLSYALGDVTHLRSMYPGLAADLEKRGRTHWVQEEIENLLSPDLYDTDPDKAWERLKIRSPKRDYLAALKATAAWRERTAIARNMPRKRVLKDDALYVIAQQRPKDVAALARMRGVPNGFEKSRNAKTLIESLKAAMDDVENYAPKAPKTRHMPSGIGPTVEMLKTLLRLKTEYDDIAPRLIANQRDIEAIAAFGDQADVPALNGWRREVYGDDALKMLNGEIALRLEGRKVVAERLQRPETQETS